MDSEANELQPKQDRLRTRWTASLDKIFADLVVEQIQLGNRRNNIFDKKTWNHIRDEFNRHTDLNFNNNQLRKHLDVLRTRYYNLKSAFDQSDFAMDDSCCIGFDLWDTGVQPKPEATKIKYCPIYEQLCTIFADLGADGKYAQSSHYEEMDKAADTNPGGSTSCPDSENLNAKTPASLRLIQGHTSSAQNMNKNAVDRKRKRSLEAISSPDQSSNDQETCDAMAKATFQMVAASKLHAAAVPQRDERYTITNCIKALDEIDGINDRVYYAALDLFEDPNLREMFISLKGNTTRLTWLLGKCG
ncbi:hypothetical protein RJ639_043387 [Escallonia herrerae]|uniref:Myb/SANT-like domain-containing protein n=1 Tax=Escallonia herrerae TaxID=1293975 RepID=A0AA88WA05_9ASTE|nr:hypothetical protein RJ639_043387 [Escallonia herrerae]